MTHTITILIFHLLIFVLLGIIIANIKKAEERKYKQMLEALEEKHRRDMQLPPQLKKQRYTRQEKRYCCLNLKRRWQRNIQILISGLTS